MGIISFVKYVCVQDAIYWEYDGSDGMDKKYKAPVAIKCRWDGSTKLLRKYDADTDVQVREVLLTQEVKTKSFLALGNVGDVTPEQAEDPLLFPDAFEVHKSFITPLFRSKDKFVYEVHLFNE